MTTAAYPEYRESSIPWLSGVPAHWDVKPVMAIARESRASNEGLIEQNLLSLSYGRIIRKDIDTEGGLLPASFETYQVVEEKDIIFRFTDLQNDQRSLRSAISPERGIITSAYLAVTPAGCDPHYFNYLMRAYDLSKVFYSMGGGLRQSLRYGDIKHLPVLLPSMPEQQAIVRYLDEETARIDVLVGKQERLIRTLRERRVALLAHSVTKGLDGDVTYRDSGLSWVGEIPIHWEVLPTRRVLQLERALVGEQSASYVLLSLTKRGIIPRDVESGEGKFPASFDTYQAVEPDDLVFCLFDMDETPRTVGLVREPGMVTGAYTRFSVNTDRALPEFLSMYYIAIDDEKRFRPLYTGLRKVVQRSRFLSAGIALPPLDEQAEIVEHVRTRTEQIDVLIQKAQQFIDVLKERRSALISAVATGQRDVRALTQTKSGAA